MYSFPGSLIHQFGFQSFPFPEAARRAGSCPINLVKASGGWLLCSGLTLIHRNFGITSFDISSRVRRTSGMGRPPKLTMQMTWVTPIFS